MNMTFSHFQKRRGDSEYLRLQKMLENTRVMHECLVPDSIKAMDNSLPTITEKGKSTKRFSNQCTVVVKGNQESS